MHLVFSALATALSYYGALRRVGLDVDLVAPGDDVSGYALLVLPCLPVLCEDWAAHLDRCAGALGWAAPKKHPTGFQTLRSWDLHQ